MKEWYEREADMGELSTMCACERRIVSVSVRDVKACRAVPCRELRCQQLAAAMNGGGDGADSAALAVPKMR